MITADDLRYLLRRPISFHRVFAEIAKGATGGLFLSQLFYWSDRGEEEDGWIYKTQEEWTKETALTRSEQERARKILRDIGLLEEERRGIPSRLFYRLDLTKLASMLDPANNVAGSAQTSPQDPADQIAGSPNHSPITETTTETTQKPEQLNSLDRIFRAVEPRGLGRR